MQEWTKKDQNTAKKQKVVILEVRFEFNVNEAMEEIAVPGDVDPDTILETVNKGGLVKRTDGHK